MTSSSPEELDQRIQFSLVSKIKQAASAYQVAKTEAPPEKLEEYLSALEGLAEYIAAKWRGSRVFHEVPAAPHRIRSKTAHRVIEFSAPAEDSSDATPMTAA